MTMPPRWQRWMAGGLLVAAVLWVIFDWPRFVSDFYPPDKSSVGPNLLASLVQAVFILIVLALIYPPTRHWIERAIESHAHELKSHVKEEMAEVHAKMADLHDCLDRVDARVVHVIAHSDHIPNLPDMEDPPVAQPPA